MKERYETPELDVRYFVTEDVITDSALPDDDDTDIIPID